MTNHFSSALAQILLFSTIPFIAFLISKKSPQNFFNQIGLIHPKSGSIKSAIILSLLYSITLSILFTAHPSILEIIQSPITVAGKIRAMGLSVDSVLTLLIIAILSTALSEEILFRGFIAKKLIKLLGHKKGNILQAIIFGLVHLWLVALNIHNIAFLCIAFISPTLLAYFIVEINEKQSNGSIIPGIIAHAISNIIGYAFIGYVLRGSYHQ